MCCRAQPADVEGCRRGDRRGSLEAEQGVGDVEEVPEVEVCRPHPRLTVFQVDRHAALALVFVVGAEPAFAIVAGLEWDRPEQAARVGMDPGVEVVNLGGEVLEVEPTSVKVQSNESECSPVDGAVLADVNALHKAHVGVEEERLDAAVGMPGGSLAPHVRDTDKALKSMITDGSIPCPKKVKWNVTPPIVTALVVGLGARPECAAADPAAGQRSPLPSEAPVAAAAAPPIKARREGMCRAWCEDDSELSGSGHPLLSIPNNCIVPPSPERI
jgi:hypothetical protein